MSNSGRKINYAIRPGKSIERKMMRDVFGRLSVFSSLSQYRYIGFGAKYFADFSLFHKYLDIGEMISIEADRTNKNRYLFNRPFSSIQMFHGRSTEVLPELMDVEQKKTILWLDYDGMFEKYMLEDVSIFSKNASSGDVLSVSFNIEPLIKGTVAEDESTYLEARLKDMVEEKYVEPRPDPRGWRTSKKLAVFLKNVVYKKIQEILIAKNLSAAFKEVLHCEQILFFTYADGAEMATVSFIFYSEKEKNLYDQCKFHEFYFFSGQDDPFDIKTPNLTMKEVRHIMEVMPNIASLDPTVFAEADIRAMWKNYRYFPNFSEVEGF